MSAQYLKAAVDTPQISPGDRLGMTLCLAIVLHAIVVLGITFIPDEIMPSRYESMEVILVQQRSEAPEEADFLAQANLIGGGDTDEKVSPATPLEAPFPDQEPEVTAPPQVEPVPPPLPPAAEIEELEELEPVARPEPVEEVIAVDTPDPAPAIEPEPVQEEPQPAPEETTPVEVPAETAPDAVETEVAEVPVETRPQPSAATLLSNSMQIAALSAQVRRKMEAQAQRPRRKFISASTQEFRYASYMEAWRAKVERVGNLNYPEEARRRGMTGSLVLDVALKPDGSVHEITVRRTSGNNVLDDAAIRIVKLSAPFAPFPDDIRAETDILHITRTWQFLSQRFQ